MRPILSKKLMSSFIASAHLFVSVLLVVPNVSFAQATDFDPPTIELETVDKGVLGETQVFSAVVTDDNQLDAVTLRYRFGGQVEYRSVLMEVIGGTDIYTASVDTLDSEATVIQYYLEAKDIGGNRTVQGFAFEPFERSLVDDVIIAASPVEPVSNDDAVASFLTPRNIVYVALGALAVGGLVLSTRDSKGEADGGDGQVELTIFVDEFQ